MAERGFLNRFARTLSQHRSACFAIAAAAVVAVTWGVASAELGSAPKARDRQVSFVVASLVRSNHLSRRPFDDEIAQRGLKLFLKTLDPAKMYFLQADIDEFQKSQNQLDDQLKEGDIKFGYAVYHRFTERVEQRLPVILKWIDTDHDFNVHEELVIDPDSNAYAKTDAEADDRWRRRIKYDLLVLKGAKNDLTEARNRLKRRYNGYAKRIRQTDSDELLEMYLTAFTSAFDPHTTYMSPSSKEGFEITMSLQLEGIGAALQSTDGYTVISKVIPKGPADKDGRLKPEDRIVSVGQGTGGEMLDVMDMKLNDVVDRIRGKAGTIVRLGVLSPGETEMKIYELTRAKVELTDSEARGVIMEDGRRADGSPYKIGVINLPSFYQDMAGYRRGIEDYKSTTRDVRKILDDFKAKGIDAVVLDLRHNGGGSLQEAISLTGLFIDEGPVVQVKDPKEGVHKYDDLERGMAWDGPLVVVTNKFSASASEILAGAIQDYRRGLIVGDEATFGKGTVQSLMDLGEELFKKLPKTPNMGSLKLTMQQFYRPNGDTTQKRGVLADIALPSITSHMDVGEADLDYAVEFDKVSPASFGKVELVTPDLVKRLKEVSGNRVQASEDWQKELRSIQRYVDFKSRKSVQLNEKEFFEARKELDAEKEEERQFDQQEKNREKDEVVKRDFYFNEILAITVDYINELKTRKVVRAR